MDLIAIVERYWVQRNSIYQFVNENRQDPESVDSDCRDWQGRAAMAPASRSAPRVGAESPPRPELKTEREFGGGQTAELYRFDALADYVGKGAGVVVVR